MAFKLATKSLLTSGTRTVSFPKLATKSLLTSATPTVSFPKTFQRTMITPLIGVRKQLVGFRNFLPAASRFFSETANDKNTHDMLWSIIDSEPKQVYNFTDESVFEVADVSPDKITFLKRYNGGFVRVQAHDRPSKVEENDDENSENSKQSGTMRLTVVSLKEDETQLHFFIRAFHSEIRIYHIALLVPNQDDFLVYRYEFSDLDENLQSAFYKYLAVRGVTSTRAIRRPHGYVET